MSTVAANLRGPAPALLVAGLGIVLAVAIGLAAADPTSFVIVPLGLLGLVGTFLFGMVHPRAAFMVVAASSIMLIAFALPRDRGVNLFDLLLPAILVACVFGTARQEAVTADVRQRSEGHLRIGRATERLVHATLVYYAIAALSIGWLVASGHAGAALNSAIGLARALQGLLLFPLGLWLMRSDGYVIRTFRAMLIAGGVLAAVNAAAVTMIGAERGGNTWYVNSPSFRLDWPNEAATSLVFLILILIARQQMRPRWTQVAMIAVSVVFVVATRSRTGLMELATLTLLLLPRARWKWLIVTALVIAALLPLVPSDYWQRLANTVFLQRGSYDAYSALMRVIAWKAAWATFLAHPWFGVGYLGFSSFSSAYNDQGLILGTAENYYLEIAAGLGIPGLIALGVVIVRLFQLGQVVHRVTPPGTLGHTLSGLHVPFIIAILVANLPGDILIGMMGVGQVALWCALIVRTGRHALEVQPS